jgi:hypothetical protein
MADLFPILGTPIPTVEPETGYSGLLIWLSIAPKLDKPGIVDANASIMAKPYRMLKDGTIDIAPESMTKSLHVASALDEVERGSELGAAVAQIAAVLQAALSTGL